jgi:hypothetical protein
MKIALTMFVKTVVAPRMEWKKILVGNHIMKLMNFLKNCSYFMMGVLISFVAFNFIYQPNKCSFENSNNNFVLQADNEHIGMYDYLDE